MIASDYLAQLAALLPPGAALPREPDSVLMRLLSAPAAELARVEARAAALLDEADPRVAADLFEAWERVAGLPDDCQPIERFRRDSLAWWFDAAGQLRQAGVGEVRRPPLGRPEDAPLIEPRRANQVRNARAEGAAPGVAPSFWAVSGNGGITATVLGTAVEGGMPCVDIRFQGTVASVGNLFVWPELANVIAAATGQTWASSYYARRVGAMVGGPTNHRAWVAEISAALGVVVQGFGEVALPTDAAIASQRAVYIRTLSGGATVAWIRPLINLVFGPGTHDGTLRIGLPQAEQGDGATTPILPPVGSLVSSVREADEYSVAGLAERRARVLARLTERAGQSRAYFLGLADALGVGPATITEYRQTDCEAGCETPLLGEDWVHAWQMTLAGSLPASIADCEDHCEIPLAQWAGSPAECVLRRLAPAHTTLVIAYA